MATETKPAETRKRSINRLQSVYAFRNWLEESYKKTREAQQEGRPIAWFMLEGFCRPIINNFDVQAVGTENFGAACASTGKAYDYVGRSEAEGFSTTLCSYAQNCFGYTARMMLDLGGEIPPEAPQGGMPKPALLIGQSGGTCDARYKWYQALGRYLDCPVWITDVPSGAMSLDKETYENDIRYIYTQVKDFVTFCENLFKKKFDYDRFEQDLATQAEYQEIWYEIQELRKARPCPMNSRDHYTSMNASSQSAANPEEVKELYRNMREEVRYRVENGIAGINYPERYRLAFRGPGPWRYLNTFDQLAEKGWNFLRQQQPGTAPIDLSWVKDPIERLVRYRRRSLEWTINDAFPDAKEAAEVKEEIRKKGFSDKLEVVDTRDYQLDGEILHTPISCRAHSSRSNMIRYRLMKVWKVPSLVVVADMADPRLFDPEDYLKRCEAFEETMDHYKEIRKREGLPW